MKKIDISQCAKKYCECACYPDWKIVWCENVIEPTQGERDMQERLAAMEQRWKEANARQKATIDRLMSNRQKVLDILNQPHSRICSEDLKAIREALG